MPLKLISGLAASLTAACTICIVYGNIEMCIDDLVSVCCSFLHQTDVALRVALPAAHVGQMVKQQGAGRGRVFAPPETGIAKSGGRGEGGAFIKVKAHAYLQSISLSHSFLSGSLGVRFSLITSLIKDNNPLQSTCLAIPFSAGGPSTLKKK